MATKNQNIVVTKALKEKQRELQEQKWLESEKQGKDLSGNMPYCANCECLTMVQSGNYCPSSQYYVETTCACARAFNAMKKTKKVKK